jgi:small subunit ribosomal protein S21|tara:strand:- start:1360 stop:1569 length:210 start_codon:yes stop_codon:yes gene_type:complete
MTIKIDVRNGNLEQAMRILKKKLMKDGLMKTLKLKQFYEKPSDKRVRKAKEMRANFIKNKKKMERLRDS